MTLKYKTLIMSLTLLWALSCETQAADSLGVCPNSSGIQVTQAGQTYTLGFNSFSNVKISSGIIQCLYGPGDLALAAPVPGQYDPKSCYVSKPGKTQCNSTNVQDCPIYCELKH